MKQKLLIWMIVLLGTVGLVTAVPSVQLVDTNAISYLNIYQYNVSVHNNLTGLQGGQAPNEYYHLTAAQHAFFIAGSYLNISGGTMQGNINMDGNSLTNVGELIMTGLTTAQHIYPTTHDLYSLGNSTHWWASAYITDLYASTIDTTNLTSTNIDSANINGTNMESEVLEVKNNMTLGNFVVKDDGADMVIILT
uniref:Uncharacterized protein n=1 Tax=viral metagenome TaxID=1070528 RepID=A0A6H1ZHN5_9ZZZZ